MSWSIIFYKNVAEEIEHAWPSSIQKKFVWTMRLITAHGPEEVGMPYVKALGKGLFELRIQGQEGIGRVLFCLLDSKRVFILNAFIKKTQKIPTREIELANKRLKELKELKVCHTKKI
jgi:phage-related protein